MVFKSHQKDISILGGIVLTTLEGKLASSEGRCNALTPFGENPALIRM